MCRSKGDSLIRDKISRANDRCQNLRTRMRRVACYHGTLSACDDVRMFLTYSQVFPYLFPDMPLRA